MFGFRERWLGVLAAVGLAAGCAGLFRSAPPPPPPTSSQVLLPTSSQVQVRLPTYSNVLTLGSGAEWRFLPLVVDLIRDGHLDLVATARLVKQALHIWLSDGKGAFTPIKPTWTDIGYAGLATGDINGDGFPDIVAASHFGRVQTLLSDGKGGFTEKILRREDGYVAAQLADLDGDGYLDLILVGYEKAGLEIYLGDGTGNWKPTRGCRRLCRVRPCRVGLWSSATSITTVTWTWSWRSSAGASTSITAMAGEASPEARWTSTPRPASFNRSPWVTSTTTAIPTSSSTEPLPAGISLTARTSIWATAVEAGKPRPPG